MNPDLYGPRGTGAVCLADCCCLDGLEVVCCCCCCLIPLLLLLLLLVLVLENCLDDLPSGDVDATDCEDLSTYNIKQNKCIVLQKNQFSKLD